MTRIARRRLIYGVGINDAEYITHIKVEGRTVACPYSRCWRKMLERCYSPEWLKLYPSYIGCEVYAPWHRFTSFKAWMVGQSWVGLQLDKDIIGNGKLYSPDTCVFVSPQVNSFIKSSGYRGICLRGVTRLPGGRFRADGVNESGDRVYLGVFATNEDAHLAWAKDKAATANMLAAKQSDLRVAGGLRRFAVELLDGLTLG